MGPYISEGGEMDQFLSDDFCVVFENKEPSSFRKVNVT
jgi:hypothetical protein